MDPIEEIKQLYYKATAQTIQRDVERAIDLLKTLPDEAARERVAVYMDGLAQMRSEWAGRKSKPAPPSAPRSAGSSSSSSRAPRAARTAPSSPASPSPPGSPSPGGARTPRPGGRRPKPRA